MPQTLFRLGGLGTVRGFEYGTLRAPAFWAAQLDLTPFGARVRPVIFLDAGQASRISRLFSTSALVGGGVGLSLFSGLIRFDLSRPITPDQSGKVRFDLVIQGVR
jgi:hemolysin activation/secretion protein